MHLVEEFPCRVDRIRDFSIETGLCLKQIAVFVVIGGRELLQIPPHPQVDQNREESNAQTAGA
jgi:hypothetical protein